MPVGHGATAAAVDAPGVAAGGAVARGSPLVAERCVTAALADGVETALERGSLRHPASAPRSPSAASIRENPPLPRVPIRGLRDPP